jgi:hypothetical protein
MGEGESGETLSTRHHIPWLPWSDFPLEHREISEGQDESFFDGGSLSGLGRLARIASRSFRAPSNAARALSSSFLRRSRSFSSTMLAPAIPTLPLSHSRHHLTLSFHFVYFVCFVVVSKEAALPTRSTSKTVAPAKRRTPVDSEVLRPFPKIAIVRS